MGTGPKRWPSLLAGLLLLAYLAWLFWSAWSNRFPLEWPVLTVAELQETERLTAWADRAARAALTDAAWYLPLGLLLAIVFRRGKTRIGGAVKWLAALVIAVGLAVAVRGVESRGFPVAGQLWLPGLGCLAGVCLGTTLLGGIGAMIRTASSLVLLSLLLAGSGAWLLDACLDREPLEFEMPRVTSAEKRRIVNQIRTAPRSEDGGVRLRHVELSDDDLNFLLAWWCSLGPAGTKAQLHFAQEHIEAEASVPAPLPHLDLRHLNLRASGGFALGDDGLRVQLQRLQIGGVDVPTWLLKTLSPQLESFIDGDSDVGSALKAIRSIDVDAGAVSVVYEEEQFKRRVLSSLTAETNEQPELLSAIETQVRQLIEAAPTLPTGEARFGAFLQTAFALARERSEDGDAVHENRAAVYALAILLGHRRVEWLTGFVLDDDLLRAARQHLGRVTIRGRGDWTQHFLVSAALALRSSETLSDAAGLLKEELDAGRGGSGFSFADLLADRAGTLFALAACRDDQSARALQDRLAAGFEIDDFFPPADDLPEGIPDAEFESRYGGVGGAEYQRLIDEIERRLQGCEGLR